MRALVLAALALAEESWYRFAWRVCPSHPDYPRLVLRRRVLADRMEAA